MPLLDKPSVCLELARENSWEGSRGRAFAGYPIEPGCPLGLKNSGTVPELVPELVRETTAMNWAVGGGIERRFHPKDGFRDQFRRRLSRLGAHRMR
jgi:hypothetical protein